MLIKFDLKGNIIEQITDDYWGQGDNNTDELIVEFYNNGIGVSIDDKFVSCIVKRPDGVVSPKLLMANYTTYAKLLINNWITEVPGNVQFVIQLKEEDKITTTGIFYRVIGQGIPPADQTITDAEYEALLNAIQDKRTEVDDAMSNISTNPVQNKVVKNYIDEKSYISQTIREGQYEDYYQILINETNGKPQYRYVTQPSNTETIKNIATEDFVINTVKKPLYFKGSLTATQISTMIMANVEEGWMYNITEDFESNVNFVEGEGIEYPSGTNVVCVLVNGIKKWDIFFGLIDLSGKQDKLVSGTNIKTINGQSLLGSGAITHDSEMNDTSLNSVQNKVIKEYIDNKVDNQTIALDTTMSNTSENGVQNKVIKNYVDGKDFIKKTIRGDNYEDTYELSFNETSGKPQFKQIAYPSGTTTISNLATEKYVDDKIGEINSILDTINGEVI